MQCNAGIRLYEKAKTIIPGGTQLLSKRPEMFLPGLWPSYYSKAKGCEIWDLDGNRFYDFANMGVGSCVLGYGDDDVNAAVIAAINNGSMSTLNCPEEVELAETLISLNPWADMVRFSRTGGEACAVAVRIGRAATGRSKVAFCGYHGWHDWYLSANIADSSNLNDQLLPGLDATGVPKELSQTAIPFNYNRLDELEEIVKEHGNEIGVIIMEPQRATDPEDGFLKGVREIATKIGAALIFDEVTSGFRMNVGGIHLLLGVEPDIAVYGKALGNGYPISAIVGRKEIMESAQNSFISSTFWTERIGYAAAITTIEKMQRYHVQESLIHYGMKVANGLREAADKHKLDIHVSGIPPLTHVSFVAEDPLKVQTLYTQEMLELGYLVGSAIYMTYAYSDELIEKFISHTDEVFEKIKMVLNHGELDSCLKGEARHSGFKRLT